MKKLTLIAVVENEQEVETRLKLWETIIKCKTKRWALASEQATKEEQKCKAIE